jgi:hypothetical protein
MQLKALRPSMRAHSIKHKLISDPEHRTDLTGAITVVGTCMDMCPQYERHEREFQKDVDDWEKVGFDPFNSASSLARVWKVGRPGQECY